MNWYRSFSIGFSTIAVLLAAQFRTAAETPTDWEAESSQATGEPTLVSTTRLRPYLLLPELPTIDTGDSIERFLPEVNHPIRLVLRLSERRVYVYEGETLKNSYPVAIGRPGWETPTGSYEVIGMLQDPGWTNPFTGEVVPPGPYNPLGERWIAFWTDGRNYIGFHGTPNPESVGQAASHGCVRMFNHDIRELYEIVSMGTTVVVEN
ncbi:L,D-transpeptidase [Egbenema bharatensis]|uniref:L,D-transpeptidase n=1 Tax=Egbenema bharatensis TaxID=3463334 RepID=UPI003A849F0E